MQRSTQFLIIVGILVLILYGVALFWHRIYQDNKASPRQRLLKNSIAPLVLRLVVRTLDMAFFILLQRNLPSMVIGTYDIAVLFVGQYLVTITEFGLGILLTREVARDPAAARRLFGVTLLLRWLLVLSVSCPLIFLFVAGYDYIAAIGLGEALAPESQHAIWILFLTLIPSAYSGAVTALYNAKERMEVPAFIEVLTAIAGLATRLAVLWLGFGIIGLAWSAVGVSTATALLFLWLQYRDFFPPILVWDRQQLRQLLLTAFPLMLNNLLMAVFFRVDIFLLKAFGSGQGDTLVNQYNIAYKVLSIPTMLPPIITFAVFPLLARHAANARDTLTDVQNQTHRVLLMIAFPLTVGISIYATDIIHLISGSNAAQVLPRAAHALGILIWFLPLSYVNGLTQYVLIALNRQSVITRAFAGMAAFNLVGNLLLIPLYDIYAASVMTILSEAILYLLFLPVLRREQITPPLGKLAWRPAVAGLIMGIAMLGLSSLHWVVALVAAPMIYMPVLWLLGAFGPEERALARRVLGRS